MPTLANAATEHDSEFDELLALNPGVSASELASALDAESSEKGDVCSRVRAKRPG